jgi:hypothetical protein
MLRTESSQETGLTGKRSSAIAWGDLVVLLLGCEMTRCAPGDLFASVPLLRWAVEGVAWQTLKGG